MPALRLNLLGPPDLIVGGQRAAFKTRKALALLAYLAVEKGPHPREAVADLLWPSANVEHARSSLRMTIRYVRDSLGEETDAVLLATRDAIGLAPSAPLDLDVAALSSARQRIRTPYDTERVSGVVPGGLRQDVEHAVSRYRGSFLGDVAVPDAPEFDAWLAGQRAHWVGVVSELLDWLSAVQLEADESGTTRATLERWVAIDPGEEVAWQRLLEFHLAQGNRVSARQTWSAYRRALADLGIEPSAALEAFRSHIEASLQSDSAAGYRTERRPGVVLASPGPDESDLVQALFVGRGRELMQLRRAFERAQAGEPQVVVLEGETGIGKTRLGEEFLTWAASQGADVMRSGGYETIVDLPYASLIEGLRSRLERENAPDDLLDDPWLAELSRLLPELRVRYPDLPPATLDPGLGRHQLFEAVTRLLKAFADRRPLVLFRDDWHWSDTNSRDLMRYALRRWSEDQGRVLVIFAVSSEHLGTDRALAQWMGGLERDAPTTWLGLARLTESDVVLWMAALAGTAGEGSFTDAAAARLGSWLIERAAGNPSQIVVALRTLLEQQVVTIRQSEDGSWALDLTGLPQLSAVPARMAESVAGIPSRHQDWGDAPDGRLLYGRTRELETLERWVVEDRSRVVALLGIGGIGKTTLAARLAHDVASRFEFVYWRSLRNALPFDEWLADAVRTLSEQRQVTLPDNQEERILLLLELLRSHRCLLILDNFETIIQPGQRESSYRVRFDPYGLMLQRVGVADHQSCLLLTSREKPLEVGLLEGEEARVRAFGLSGLGTKECQDLLQSDNLKGAGADWESLVERYAGNPLALEIVGETIGEVFGGDLATFLQEGEAVYGGIRRVLDSQFERLSLLEQTLLYWLAIDREPVGFVELLADLEPRPTRGEVLEAIEGLRHRSLLERGKRGAAFTLQPVVLEYVTNRLISAAGREIGDRSPELLRTHALSKAQSKSYIRASQERLIVAPILDRLVAACGSRQRVERELLDSLEALRLQDRRDYAPGNMIRLLLLLRGNLRGLDLSHLFIRQVYLQEADAQDVSLAGSTLAECALADAFNWDLSLTFSPDGRCLAAGTFDGEVCVWQVLDGTRIPSMQGHRGLLLGWARNGRLLATNSLDATVRLWEISQGVSSGRLLATLEGHTRFARGVSLSQDGSLIATCSSDGTVKLWETSTGRLLHTLQGHTGVVYAVDLSNDGLLAASCSYDGTVKLWDTTSGSLLTTLEGRSGILFDVVLTRDGRLVAAAGHNGIIRLWEVATGRLVASLEGHTEWIWCLAVSTDGNRLISGSEDGTVRLWDITQASSDVPGGACLAALQAHPAVVYDVAISPDAGRFASASLDGTVKLWEIPTGKPVTTVQGYVRGASGVAWDGSGELLATGMTDGTVNLWDVTAGALCAALHGHTSAVRGVAFSADGRLLASGGLDATIRLWQVADGACLRTVQAHAGGVYSLAFSPDGRLLMSAGEDGMIKLWDVPSGEMHAAFQAHTDFIWSIALSEEGQLLASASQDGTLKLWEIPSGRLLATMRDQGDAFFSVALSRDGSLLASGGLSGRVTIWEVNREVPSGRFLATLGAHDGPVWGVGLSPDASLMASGGADGAVMLWDLTQRVPARGRRARLMGHEGPVSHLAVSLAGDLIASCGEGDGTVMLWDIESGARRATLRPDRRYERMDITGLTGVSEVQKTVLKTLGAVERSR